MKLNIKTLREKANSFYEEKEWIKVGMATCGIAAGAQDIFNILKEEIKKRNLNIPVKKCGCQGSCYAEPLVEVKVEGLLPITYGRVDKDLAIKIVEKHVVGKMLINDAVYYFDI